MARGRGVAVLGPRLGIRGLTRGIWGGSVDSSEQILQE